MSDDFNDDRRDGQDRRQGKPELSDGYTRIANELLEAEYRDPEIPVWIRIMTYLKRYTFGFGRSTVKRSQRQIAEDLGVSRSVFNRHMKRLIKSKRVVIANPGPACVTGQKLIYRINKYYDAWEPLGPVNGRWTQRVSQVLDPACVTGLDPACVTGHVYKETDERKLLKEREATSEEAARPEQPEAPPDKPKKPKAPPYRPPTGAELKATEPWLNPIAWDEWITYRVEIKKPYKTQVGVTKAVNVLRGLDYQGQQATIDKSIAAEYQGLFPPKKNGNGAHEPREWDRKRQDGRNSANMYFAMKQRRKEISNAYRGDGTPERPLIPDDC